MTEKAPRGFPRRIFMRAGASLLTELALDPVLAKIPDILRPSNSSIIFSESQTKRLAETKTACIVLGGSNFGSAEPLVEWLTPALEPLGGVGAIKYGTDGIGSTVIAKEIQRLKAQGVTEFSFYGHSLGTQIAGMVMQDLEAVGDDINLKHIIMDCTPPSLDYTRYPKTAKIGRALPPSADLTGLGNAGVFNNPFHQYAASPDLFDEQIETLYNGEAHLTSLKKAVDRHHTKVTFLRPENPEKDSFVDPVASEKRLFDFFPGMKVYRLGGNYQQHGVDPKNLYEYFSVIKEALA